MDFLLGQVDIGRDILPRGEDSEDVNRLQGEDESVLNQFY